jgi:LmbE family N-acetylglucosaminyl deacetylase
VTVTFHPSVVKRSQEVRLPSEAKFRVERSSDGKLELVEAPPGPYLILSPHLDDAALSCGALLARLAPARDVTVFTLFTEASVRSTLSARAYVRQCGYFRAAALYEARRTEDLLSLQALGVDCVHAGFVDALFRLKPRVSSFARWAGYLVPELVTTYPTYRRHVSSGVVSPRDAQIVDEIRAAISLIMKHTEPTVIAPLGVGRHVDHVLARGVAESIGAAAVVYYADLPYALHVEPDSAFIKRHDLVRVSVGDSQRAKPELVAGYRSQVSALFDGSIPELPECYFVSTNRIEIV